MNKHTSVYRIAVRAAVVTAILLLVPLVAMQFTGDVNWGPGDFIIAGALLFGTGFVFGLAARAAGSTAHRLAAGLALFTALFLVWSSLAVGIIGADGDPADLMYAGVLAVGAVGTAIARFRPLGMSRVLFATALAQATVAVIALLLGKHLSPGSSVLEILRVNAFFVVLFVVSALLFRQAARRQPSSAMPTGA